MECRSGNTDRRSHAPLHDRLVALYRAYARTILRREGVRTFVFAGLSREGFDTRYLSRLHERVFVPVLRELRHEYDRTDDRRATRDAMRRSSWSGACTRASFI